ncbi:MAG TPA: GNAT family N-acetyltransferase [Terricaulis sp.]|nr:GNAT family N-acetyltransferase [Terricaulis sp.]
MQTDPVRVFADAWRLMTGRLPGSQFKEADALVSCFCDVPSFFFNVWIPTAPTAAPEAFENVLREGVSRAQSAAHPVGALLREDWLPADWQALAANHGFVPAVPMTPMEAEDLAPPRRPQPAELQIRRVASDAGARELAQLNADAYGMPHDMFGALSTMALWAPDSLGFVGYVDGRPVSATGVFPVGGTVYVAMVATAPDVQGKGYAEAVMRHAVIEGQKAMGVKRTTLHATDAGRPVYAAMGYASGPRMLLLAPPH